jgi:hypothetical protein
MDIQDKQDITYKTINFWFWPQIFADRRGLKGPKPFLGWAGLWLPTNKPIQFFLAAD